jgi:Rv2525c-like, glycoside hydrolase-like domain
VRLWKLVLPVAVLASGIVPAQAVSEQIVSYRGYEVTVPADWPVVDLAKTPTACVRFDRPAVYLGRSIEQPDCPAHLVGRAEGLVLEPLTKAARTTDGEIQQAVADAGVLATAYYAPGGEQAARDVLSTGRVTSKTSAVVQPRAAAVTPSIVATGTVNGLAFDACTAPAQSAMDAWLPPNSSYKAVGIYISGAVRGCAQPNLTPSWVSTNAAKGWQFLLIDVGLQAPCNDIFSAAKKMSADPATAREQGRTAANGAISAATALGFAQRSAIYSDIENYPSDASCKAAVLSYLSGWAGELSSRGYVSGAYVGAASGGVDLSAEYNNTAYTRVDNLWFARWNNVATTADSGYITQTGWTNHQRVHQYAGNQTESHGGVSIDIDRNALDLTAPPPAPAAFDAVGQYGSAKLTWTVPAGTILGQVIVRSNTGTVAPGMPNTGTSVYAGTGTSATVTGLAASTSYAYSAWVKDNSGKIGPRVSSVLVGSGTTIAASTPALTYGGGVTLYSRVTRKDNNTSLVGVPMALYARAKNGTTWTTVATATTDSNGQVASTQKPSVSTVYVWRYNGSTDFLGSQSGNATIEVRPMIYPFLTATAIKLGGTTTFYGYMRPSHPGTTMYLQRQTGPTTWPNVATTKVNSTGNYAFSIKPGAKGTFNYRVVWLADADHATSVSATKTVTVS